MTLRVAGRRLAQSLSLAFIVVQLSSSVAHASNITYTVNTTITSAIPTGNPLQSNTVLGSITTDGTIGVLATSDILSWNLNLIDNLNHANNFDLTTANSLVDEDTGGGLSATATELSFDFGATSAEFLIQVNPGEFSGFNYFCFSTGGACFTGETITPSYIFGDGAVLAPGATTTVGVQPLDQTPPSTVPEPSTYALVLTGLVGLSGGLIRNNGHCPAPRPSKFPSPAIFRKIVEIGR
jgi:hypothetical protein